MMMQTYNMPLCHTGCSQPKARCLLAMLCCLGEPSPLHQGVRAVPQKTRTLTPLATFVSKRYICFKVVKRMVLMYGDYINVCQCCTHITLRFSVRLDIASFILHCSCWSSKVCRSLSASLHLCSRGDHF